MWRLAPAAFRSSQSVSGAAPQAGEARAPNSALVVEGVGDRGQQRAYVPDLLVGPVAPAADHVGPESGPFERLLVGVEVGEGAEQDDDRAALHPGIDQLAKPGGQEPRLGQLVAGGGRVGRRPEVERPVLLPGSGIGGEQHLDRGPATRGRIARGRRRPDPQLAVALPEQTAADLVHGPDQLRPRAEVPAQRHHIRRGIGLGPVAALAEDVEVGMAEPVDRLQLIADDHQLGLAAAEGLDQTQLEPVRVLKLVDEDVREPGAVLGPDLLPLEQVDGAQLEVLEVDPRAPLLRRLEALRELSEQVSDWL